MAIKLTEIRIKLGAPTSTKSFKGLIVNAKNGGVAFDAAGFLIKGKTPYWNIYSPVGQGCWCQQNTSTLNFKLNPYGSFENFDNLYIHNAAAPEFHIPSAITLSYGSANVSVIFKKNTMPITANLKMQVYVGKWLSPVVDMPNDTGAVTLSFRIENAIVGTYTAGIYCLVRDRKLNFAGMEKSVILKSYVDKQLTLTVIPIYDNNDNRTAITGYELQCNLSEKLNSDLIFDGRIVSVGSSGEEVSPINIPIWNLKMPAGTTTLTKSYSKRTNFPLPSQFKVIKAKGSTNQPTVKIVSLEMGVSGGGGFPGGI